MSRHAYVPDGPVTLPEAIAHLAGDDQVQGVWNNDLGGRTYRLLNGERTRYLKWQNYAGLTEHNRREVDLGREEQRLRWAGNYLVVPSIIEYAEAGEDAWLLTEGIDAVSAVDPRWHKEPETAVRAIAIGLRTLHDTLPVSQCPFGDSWPRDRALAPGPSDLVVCHGDACMPNTLITTDGYFAGHVDLGQLGVCDRWADLAIATMSIGWDVNLGRNYDELFFATYGIEPDHQRIAFYRELWGEV